jgi:hypothetical protein
MSTIPIGPLEILTNLQNPITHLALSSFRITINKYYKITNSSNFIGHNIFFSSQPIHNIHK